MPTIILFLPGRNKNKKTQNILVDNLLYNIKVMLNTCGRSTCASLEHESWRRRQLLCNNKRTRYDTSKQRMIPHYSSNTRIGYDVSTALEHAHLKHIIYINILYCDPVSYCCGG